MRAEPSGTSPEGGKRGNVRVKEENLQQGWFISIQRKDAIPQGDVTVMQFTHQLTEHRNACKKKKSPADVNGAEEFKETHKWTNQRNKK